MNANADRRVDALVDDELDVLAGDFRSGAFVLDERFEDRLPDLSEAGRSKSKS